MLHGRSLSRNNLMYVRRKIKNLDDFKEASSETLAMQA
jgi:hypothetical protein